MHIKEINQLRFKISSKSQISRVARAIFHNLKFQGDLHIRYHTQAFLIMNKHPIYIHTFREYILHLRKMGMGEFPENKTLNSIPHPSIKNSKRMAIHNH